MPFLTLRFSYIVHILHSLIHWLNWFIFHLNRTCTHTPLLFLFTHKSVKFLIPFFALHTPLFSLPHTFIFFHPFLTSSLFPSPLSFLVILLNHYGGPSLLAGLSHPGLLPGLPSIFPLPHSSPLFSSSFPPLLTHVLFPFLSSKTNRRSLVLFVFVKLCVFRPKQLTNGETSQQLKSKMSRGSTCTFAHRLPTKQTIPATFKNWARLFMLCNLFVTNPFKHSTSCRRAKALEAAECCLYLQRRPVCSFSPSGSPKLQLLQVNLPVWSQTGCTPGQGRGDYTCIGAAPLCVCLHCVCARLHSGCCNYPWKWKMFFSAEYLCYARIQPIDLVLRPMTLAVNSSHTLSFGLWRRRGFLFTQLCDSHCPSHKITIIKKP